MAPSVSSVLFGDLVICYMMLTRDGKWEVQLSPNPARCAPSVMFVSYYVRKFAFSLGLTSLSCQLATVSRSVMFSCFVPRHNVPCCFSALEMNNARYDSVLFFFCLSSLD